MASQLPYHMVRGSVGPVARRLFRIRVEGLENVPTSGAAILAPNHLSFIDSIFIPLVLDRRVTYVAKAEYFESWKTAWFFKMMGHHGLVPHVRHVALRQGTQSPEIRCSRPLDSQHFPVGDGRAPTRDGSADIRPGTTAPADGFQATSSRPSSFMGEGV